MSTDRNITKCFFTEVFSMVLSQHLPEKFINIFLERNIKFSYFPQWCQIDFPCHPLVGLFFFPTFVFPVEHSFMSATFSPAGIDLSRALLCAPPLTFWMRMNQVAATTEPGNTEGGPLRGISWLAFSLCLPAELSMFSEEKITAFHLPSNTTHVFWKFRWTHFDPNPFVQVPFWSRWILLQASSAIGSKDMMADIKLHSLLVIIRVVSPIVLPVYNNTKYTPAFLLSLSLFNQLEWQSFYSDLLELTVTTQNHCLNAGVFSYHSF